MGWTYTDNPHKSVDDFFHAYWTKPDKNGYCPYIPQGKGVLKNCREYYLPIYDTIEKRYFMFVALVDLSKRNGYDIGFKDMDESMGPGYYSCPERLLAIVEQTPPENEWAAEWRMKTRMQIERKKRLKSLQSGSNIVFATPIEFSNGVTEDTFVLHYSMSSKGRKTLKLYSAHHGFCARISQWKERDFKIVEKA